VTPPDCTIGRRIGHRPFNLEVRRARDVIALAPERSAAARVLDTGVCRTG
jgi:hypothetical protein